MDSSSYHSGRMGSFVNVIVELIKKNPALLDNVDHLKAMLKYTMPALRDRSRCPNCDASMTEYTFSFDAWDALLLIAMAKKVDANIYKGMSFTLANQVRVPEIEATHAIKCRTTQTSKLGLITQLRNKANKRVPGVWVITRRGWEALSGKPVPRQVKVWRGRIEERFDETTTIEEALRSHVDSVKKTLSRGRTVKQDYRDVAEAYNPRQWYEFGTHNGALL